MKKSSKFFGIDLFAGAGGMSLGAQQAGINVGIAVEIDKYAAETYRHNHPQTLVIQKDVRDVDLSDSSTIPKNMIVVLFGGPPCQGFSTSNQRSRNQENKNNHLFWEFIRIARLINPDWIVFENVKGFVSYDKGSYKKELERMLGEMDYTYATSTLCASDYGVPQKRNRFFLVANRHGIDFHFPPPTSHVVSVNDAIGDLPSLANGSSIDILSYPDLCSSQYAHVLRSKSGKCGNHLVSSNKKTTIERYRYIPQGGNFSNIPLDLMKNYKDITRCHTGIYKRLIPNEPSIVIGNFRKNMLIHPFQDRGLSVREAARIQSFPDDYYFMGSIGYQQQQVGNAVPPLLAKAIFGDIQRRI